MDFAKALSMAAKEAISVGGGPCCHPTRGVGACCRTKHRLWGRAKLALEW